ncbi:hypothetical protein TNCT_405321 [Trichonephila clavata]|uniref:Uncharacterized protein n=1 Tax=Trichonephila clavata TaxID=2740835 RepID=A0A8X6HB12_TRICU|nr:hypothetical protein TNCT_405321 [Trichonephila clavata]
MEEQTDTDRTNMRSPKILKTHLNTEVTKEGNAPECFQKYGLERFKGTGEEEEDIKKYKALKEYMETLSTEDQKNIKTCFHETGRMAAKKMEQQMSTECVKELKQLGKKWGKLE